MAGVLGIGADLTGWTPEDRAEARELVARYKQIRDIIHTGEVYPVSPSTGPLTAVQYLTPATVVVLFWRTGPSTGTPHVPAVAPRLRLPALEPEAAYVDRDTGVRGSGTYLTTTGLLLPDLPPRDAGVIVLDRTSVV